MRIISLSCILALFAFSSCVNNAEELYINADGSGRIEFTTDLSSMYPFLMMGLQQEQESDSTEADNPFSGLMTRLTESPQFDTTFSFEDLFLQALAEEGITRDSFEREIADDPNGEKGQIGKFFLDKLFNATLNIQSNRDEATLLMRQISSFTDIDSLGNIGASLGAVMVAAGAIPDDQLGAMESMMGAPISYSLSKGKLTVHRDPPTQPDTKALDEEAQQAIAMMNMFLDQVDYKLTIHVPGKIKKVDYPGAIIDKDQVTISIPYEEWTEGTEPLDFTVKFKPKK